MQVIYYGMLSKDKYVEQVNNLNTVHFFYWMKWNVEENAKKETVALWKIKTLKNGSPGSPNKAA